MKKQSSASRIVKAVVMALFALTMLSALFACKKGEEKGADKAAKLVIGATSMPHAEMLKQLVADLKAENITLEIKEFSDYKMLNPALNEKQLDANFFQHLPYLQDYAKKSNQKLISAGGVHIEPMGLYSKKIKSLENLAEGSTIGIPNDATNEARALLLLQKYKLIKLKDGASFDATPNSIAENPKKLKFKELEAAQLPRTLADTDASIINTNYAMEGGLNPLKDAIIIEEKDSPYANILAVRDGDQNRPEIKALFKALTSEKMKKFMKEKYGDAIIPAF